MKKFIAMFLVGAVLFAGAVGCTGDAKKPADTKPKEKEKEKDAKP